MILSFSYSASENETQAKGKSRYNEPEHIRHSCLITFLVDLLLFCLFVCQTSDTVFEGGETHKKQRRMNHNISSNQLFASVLSKQSIRLPFI
jgi:hypothetical protein